MKVWDIWNILSPSRMFMISGFKAQQVLSFKKKKNWFNFI